MKLKQDEKIIYEAILDARKVQEHIWKELSLSNDIEFDSKKWGSVFQKRVLRISKIDKNHPSYKVELRKRILQQAALSICAMALIDRM